MYMNVSLIYEKNAHGLALFDPLAQSLYMKAMYMKNDTLALVPFYPLP